MTTLDLLWHLLNFGLPAAGVATALLLARPLLGSAGPLPWWMGWLLNTVLGVGVLLAGLWWFGRDGKMLSYAALVLVQASGQWLLMRGWR